MSVRHVGSVTVALRPLLAVLALMSALAAGPCPDPQSPGALHPGEERLMLEVAPAKVNCVGEAARTCLQVRTVPDGRWERFYDPIEGFTHEPGYLVRIEVGRRRVADPPADGSAWRWRLIRVVERTRGDD